LHPGFTRVAAKTDFFFFPASAKLEEMLIPLTPVGRRWLLTSIENARCIGVKGISILEDLPVTRVRIPSPAPLVIKDLQRSAVKVQ
jgi:hypothetical protein